MDHSSRGEQIYLLTPQTADKVSCLFLQVKNGVLANVKSFVLAGASKVFFDRYFVTLGSRA